MTYSLLYADPSWRFKNWSMNELTNRGEKWARRNGRSPYPVMTTDDLCKLPVGDIASRNSVLLMWATSPKIADGTADMVMRAWGFTPKTIGFTWVKLNPSGLGWHSGLGYHTRQNAEFVFIATKGKGVSRYARDVLSLVIYPRGEHSRKPPTVREGIERLYGEVSRIELFARQRFAGWDAWGNEVECSPGAGPLMDYIVPPYTAIVDEDEYNGLPVTDTFQEHFSNGEQMPLRLAA